MHRWKKLGLLPSCLFGVLAVIVLTLLLCLALTPAILRGTLPPESGSVCAAASAGLAVFAVVFLLSRARGRQAMPAAGIVAGGTVILAALLCAMGGKGFSFSPWLLRLAAAAVTGGILGAVMSIRPRNGTRRAYRR